MLVITAYECFQ